MPFGGPENKFLHFDPIFTEKQILVDFRVGLENFGSKRALTWGLRL